MGIRLERIRRNISLWYRGSSLQVYIRKTERGEKGDTIGMYLMLLYAGIEWGLLTVIPAMIFITFIFLMTLNPLVLISYILIGLSIPQLWFFWGENWMRYKKLTKEMRMEI